MTVRNFWLEAYIDGRQTNLSGGPKAKDGGFTLLVYMRRHGEPVEALRITGLAFKVHGYGEPRELLKLEVVPMTDPDNYSTIHNLLIEGER